MASKALDPVSVSLLLSSVLRLTADLSEQAHAGTISDEDITKMLDLLGHNLDTWQAKIDAHRAANP